MAFQALPALQVQGPDIVGNTLASEQIRSNRIGNRLAEQQFQAQQNKLGQESAAGNALARGIADPTKRPDALTAAAPLGPGLVADVQKAFAGMDEDQRKQVADQNEKIGKISLGFLNAPPERQAQSWPMIRQAALDLGAPPESVPQTLEDGGLEYIRQQAIKAQSVSDLAARAFPEEDKALVEVGDPSSPTGSRFVKRSKAAGLPGKATSGISLETNPDGSVSFRTGVTGDDITKTTRTNLEKGQVDAVAQFARIKEIETSFDPQFLEIGTRLKSSFSGLKEKAGIPISSEDKETLKNFSKFKRRSITNINKTLNELSGAAVSPQEAVRIRAGVPDAGDGIFDGDSPTVFKAKMDDTLESLRFAAMRFAYARARGLDALTATTLESVPDLVETEGAKIEQQVRAAAPQLDNATIDLEVKARLGSLFGIDF